VREREHRELLADADAVAPVRRLFEPTWHHSIPPAASRLERLSAHAVEVNVRLVLPNDYLAKVDTASMRHSLEVRVPLLDEDLIAFALTLPHALRVVGRRGKRVLRRVAARRLPALVAKRPKHGFDVPVDQWLDPSFAPNLQDALLEPNSPVADHLERTVYSSWVEAFCSGRPADGISRAGLYQRIVMLLSLDLALRDANTALSRERA
jgi:asparagine synthase (glutamine-hydrolysing)